MLTFALNLTLVEGLARRDRTSAGAHQRATRAAGAGHEGVRGAQVGARRVPQPRGAGAREEQQPRVQNEAHSRAGGRHVRHSASRRRQEVNSHECESQTLKSICFGVYFYTEFFSA